MQTNFIMSRLGGTALAAVLALSATPALAQEATPQEAPQITVPQEAAPAVTAEPVATPAPDPLAAQPTAEIDTTAETTAKTAATTTAKKASAPATKSTARASTTPRATSAPVAAAPVATAETAPPIADPALEPPLPVAPLAAEPVAAAPVAEPAADPMGGDTLPIALGAGLGLLALGGAAFAIRRRRRDGIEDEVIVSEPTIARRAEPTVRPEPVLAERSAFSWGTPAAATASTASSSKSWVDRAHDGPTPENPFLSLKKRLQRAAFYDQRERAVAAGAAKPLSPMAGLPRRFAEAIRPKAAPAGQMSSYGFSYAPA